MKECCICFEEICLLNNYTCEYNHLVCKNCINLIYKVKCNNCKNTKIKFHHFSPISRQSFNEGKCSVI